MKPTDKKKRQYHKPVVIILAQSAEKQEAVLLGCKASNSGPNLSKCTNFTTCKTAANS